MLMTRSRWEALMEKLDMIEIKVDALCAEHGFIVEDGPHIERQSYSEDAEEHDAPSMGAKLFGRNETPSSGSSKPSG